MAYQTKAYLQGRFETGDVPTQQDYYDVFDSFMQNVKFATVIANDVLTETIYIRYHGDTEPTFTKVSDGTYRLNVPANVYLSGLRINSTGYTATGSGSLVLVIRDASGKTLCMPPRCYQKSNGDELSAVDGVRIRRTLPTAGDVQYEIPNVSLFSGGYYLEAGII